MHIVCLLAVSAVAIASAAPAEARDRYHRHHRHDGAAVGAALGAGIFLGALAASSANAREEVYIEEAPPPVYGYDDGYRDRGEEADAAISACRRGLLDAARKYGAYDAEIGDIYSVRDRPYGQTVRVEVTIDYPEGSRTSVVTCDTEDGLLVSARSEY
jgi:hypothetical protein